MAVSVRKVLENLGHEVGYDKSDGGVTVKSADGKRVNIGRII